jgi:hypothetical protein
VSAGWAAPWQLAVLYGSREPDRDGAEKNKEALRELLQRLYGEIWKVLSPEVKNRIPQTSVIAENVYRKVSRLGGCSRPTRLFQEGLGAEGLLGVFLAILLEPVSGVGEPGTAELLLGSLKSGSASILQALDLSRLDRLVHNLGHCSPLIDGQFQLQAVSIADWFERASCREYLYVHEHQDVFWFQKEALLRLTAASLLYTSVNQSEPRKIKPDSPDGSALERIYRLISEQAEKAGFQVQSFLASWESSTQDPGGEMHKCS